MARLAWLLLLCFGVDVSNPLLPGSQRFNPDESVEGVQAERVRVGAAPVSALARSPATPLDPDLERPPGVQDARRRLLPAGPRPPASRRPSGEGHDRRPSPDDP